MDTRAGRSPISTYRLQLHAGFPFAAARAIVPYLSRLGISDCYLSPIFAARPGSTHGYDVTDHNRISDELGGAEEYDRLADDLDAAGMGQIVDIVPNHMARGRDVEPVVARPARERVVLHWRAVLRHRLGARQA